jgi:hypothetical protein
MPFLVSYELYSLNNEEKNLLRRHGTWLKALAEGHIPPFTPEQIQFVQVSRGELMAVTLHEKLWQKYCELRTEQTIWLRTLFQKGTLSLSQLRQIQINIGDFEFTPQDVEELKRQLEKCSPIGFSSDVFIEHSDTKGQG